MDTINAINSDILDFDKMDFVAQEAPSKVKPMTLGDLELPYVVKNRPLTAPGIWNGFYISADIIKKSFEDTDWTKETRSLYADHNDKETTTWLGDVHNMRFDEETGCVMGDLHFVDPSMAFKIAYGAKFGISPSFDATHDNHVITQFKFRNFAVVTQPAMLKNYINNSLARSKEQEAENMDTDAITLLAKKVDTMVKEMSDMKQKFSQEFDVSDAELTEFASQGSFAEFVGKMKKKYPDMDLKEIAKLWKKQQGTMNAQKKEEYPYPPEKKKKMEDEEDMKKNSKKDFQSEEDDDGEEETEETVDSEESGSEDSEESEDEEVKTEKTEKSVEKTEDSTTKYEQTIAKLQEKISELSAKIEKPVRNSEVSGTGTQAGELRDPAEVMLEFIEELRNK